MSKELTTVDMSSSQLQASVNQESEKRDILKGYVQSQLVSGVDYGTISIGGRESKPCLFKPGMEKILSLMGISSELEKDTDTWEMAGNKPGVICYKCRLQRNNLFLAEGRGAAAVGEKGRDINSTIKIAEKRARMDAVLSLGFSEFFTQDLEDIAPVRTSAVERQAAHEEKLSDGDYEITIEGIKNGTSASGVDWEALMTDKGRMFNNTQDILEVGCTYYVTVAKGGVTKIHEMKNVAAGGDFDDIEEYMTTMEGE